MRQDQWLNTIVIDGRPLGIWDTVSGGDVEAEETKYRPGGMAKQISLGGPEMTNNLTLSRLLKREDWAYMKSLMSGRVGRAAVTVSRQPLDVDGNPFGQPLTYRGRLQRVAPGDSDSNATDAHVWEIEVSTEGSVS